VNVLLAAHAKQAMGAKAVLECPCPQCRDAGYSLQDRLAMVRCLVEKWDANVRALITSDYGDEHYPLFIAVLSTYHNVVVFFLDECGMDVNSTTPCAKDTVLHVLVRFRLTSRRSSSPHTQVFGRREGRGYTPKKCRWIVCLGPDPSNQ
jgi:hypothetical protein